MCTNHIVSVGKNNRYGHPNKEDLDEEDITKIENAIDDKYSILSYYDVTLLKVTKDGDVIGIETEPVEYIVVKLGLSETDPVNDGYTRKYYVVRLHDGKVEIIDDAPIESWHALLKKEIKLNDFFFDTQIVFYFCELFGVHFNY